MNSSQGNVLIIEDDAASRAAMSDYLLRKKIPLLSADNGEHGLDRLSADVSVVVTDMKMPGLDGMEVLKEAKRRFPSVEVIMVTAYGDISSAVEAMKLGAADYLTKPVNPEELLIKIKNLREKRGLRLENGELRRQLQERNAFEDIIGLSPAMVAIFQRIDAVASTSSTVLITGPSGSGKELVAKAIHSRSPRKNKPFIGISGAAIPEALMESELFGHAKGAFTGATEKAAGKFEAAADGTLFLDEVAELSLSVQAKLLRVLEERSFSPLGSCELKKVDARLLFATNKDLAALVKDGLFREDLYYRVKGIGIQIPPLCERREDIPPLIDNFAKKFSLLHGKKQPSFTQDALECLKRHAWLGNVRELRNCVENLIVFLQGSEIGIENIPQELRFEIGAAHVSAPSSSSLERMERDAIEKTLRKCDGNRTKAAESLGISVRTLQRKIAQFGLDI